MSVDRDEIIRMAREAGARTEHWTTRLFPVAQILMTPEELERFAALVAADEREACAVMLEARGKALCDSAGSDQEQFAQGCEADHCADLIRARGSNG